MAPPTDVFNPKFQQTEASNSAPPPVNFFNPQSFSSHTSNQLGTSVAPLNTFSSPNQQESIAQLPLSNAPDTQREQATEPQLFPPLSSNQEISAPSVTTFTPPAQSNPVDPFANSQNIVASLPSSNLFTSPPIAQLSGIFAPQPVDVFKLQSNPQLSSTTAAPVSFFNPQSFSANTSDQPKDIVAPVSTFSPPPQAAETSQTATNAFNIQAGSVTEPQIFTPFPPSQLVVTTTSVATFSPSAQLGLVDSFERTQDSITTLPFAAPPLTQPSSDTQLENVAPPLEDAFDQRLEQSLSCTAPTINLFNPQSFSEFALGQEGISVTRFGDFSVPTPRSTPDTTQRASGELLQELPATADFDIQPESVATLHLLSQQEASAPPVTTFSPQVQSNPFAFGEPSITDLSKRQPEFVAEAPANIFNQQQSFPSTVNFTEIESASAETVNLSSTGVQFFNPIDANQNTSQTPPQLTSFFGSENKTVAQPQVVAAPAVSEIVPEARQIVPSSSGLDFGTSGQPIPFNNNFFDTTPFNPFQQQQESNIATETFTQSDDIITGIQDLALDKENNLITATEENIQQISVIDPISFFNNNISTTATATATPIDQLSVTSTSTTSNEFSIQSFFNNPPPLSDLQENVQDSNYNLIRTNLLNKRIERVARIGNPIAGNESPEALSVASVIAEPSSSVQSELSEYAEQPIADSISQSVPESLQSNQVSEPILTFVNWKFLRV